jgi:ferredoxin-NADP reductase
MNSMAPTHGNRMVRVARKETIADGVVRLTLEEPSGDRLPYWTPGAHIDLILPTSTDESIARQYSLCGDRWQASAYQVAVLREPASRGGSQYVHDTLAEGDLLSVSTPRNNFAMAPALRPLFIAGGIGITPIMTMIDSAERLGLDWHLLYGGRTRTSLAFADELAQYDDRVDICPQDETGLLDLSHLEDPIEGAQVYCCGPAPLLEAVQRVTAKWPAGSVRFERFSVAAQPPPVRTGPFTVDLARSGTCVTVTPQESVLEALATVGVSVLSSCKEGLCGTCEVGVLRGIPDHRDSLLDDAEREANDRMFVCVSRSVTERLVLDI